MLCRSVQVARPRASASGGQSSSGGEEEEEDESAAEAPAPAARAVVVLVLAPPWLPPGEAFIFIMFFIHAEPEVQRLQGLPEASSTIPEASFLYPLGSSRTTGSEVVSYGCEASGVEELGPAAPAVENMRSRDEGIVAVSQQHGWGNAAAK